MALGDATPLSERGSVLIFRLCVVLADGFVSPLQCSFLEMPGGDPCLPFLPQEAAQSPQLTPPPPTSRLTARHLHLPVCPLLLCHVCCSSEPTPPLLRILLNPVFTQDNPPSQELELNHICKVSFPQEVASSQVLGTHTGTSLGVHSGRCTLSASPELVSHHCVSPWGSHSLAPHVQPLSV